VECHLFISVMVLTCVTLTQILYGAVPAAYTREPWECINYAACHDNETLYDQVENRGVLVGD
jgi:pullulanase/glycogen debranching enzyme